MLKIKSHTLIEEDECIILAHGDDGRTVLVERYMARVVGRMVAALEVHNTVVAAW